MSSSPRTPLKSFLSQHFTKGKRLTWFRKIIEHGCMFVYIQSIGCVLFGFPLISKLLFNNPSLIHSLGIMSAGMLSIIFAKIALQSMWLKWFEHRGYSMKHRSTDPEIIPVSSKTTQQVYDCFAQLPSTIENMLFEKQLRTFQKKNQLPKVWWEELERELEKHVCNHVQSVTIEVQSEPSLAILENWNSATHPAQKL